MLRILFFFLFIAVHQLSAFNLAKQDPCTIAHSPPNSFVNDSVNVIEGNFCFSTTHLSMPGHLSLPLIQYYNSQSNYSSWLGTGMTLNYSFWIQGQEDSGKLAIQRTNTALCWWKPPAALLYAV